jgi:hypothetical protein
MNDQLAALALVIADLRLQLAQQAAEIAELQQRLEDKATAK